jgi:hypothetical protein
MYHQTGSQRKLVEAHATHQHWACVLSETASVGAREIVQMQMVWAHQFGSYAAWPSLKKANPLPTSSTVTTALLDFSIFERCRRTNIIGSVSPSSKRCTLRDAKKARDVGLPCQCCTSHWFAVYTVVPRGALSYSS